MHPGSKLLIHPKQCQTSVKTSLLVHYRVASWIWSAVHTMFIQKFCHLSASLIVIQLKCRTASGIIDGTKELVNPNLSINLKSLSASEAANTYVTPFYVESKKKEFQSQKWYYASMSLNFSFSTFLSIHHSDSIELTLKCEKSSLSSWFFRVLTWSQLW